MQTLFPSGICSDRIIKYTIIIFRRNIIWEKT